MSTTLDAYALTLRNQAEARARGVAEPPMTVSATAAIAALDEISDARLVLAWLAADETRSITVGAGVLSLKVDDEEEESVTVTSGSAVLTAGQRTSLRAAL